MTAQGPSLRKGASPPPSQAPSGRRFTAPPRPGTRGLSSAAQRPLLGRSNAPSSLTDRRRAAGPRPTDAAPQPFAAEGDAPRSAAAARAASPQGHGTPRRGRPPGAPGSPAPQPAAPAGPGLPRARRRRPGPRPLAHAPAASAAAGTPAASRGPPPRPARRGPSCCQPAPAAQRPSPETPVSAQPGSGPATRRC